MLSLCSCSYGSFPVIYYSKTTLMQKLVWLIALYCSYLISPSFSVTFIPKGFLNIALLRVPASLIFILNATITAASLWPFTYWKGEWITRDPKTIDAKRCDKSAESSLFLSLPYLCIFSIPCRFYAGVFFRVGRPAEM